MKPRVGIFGFTGCAGCQLQILNLEDEFLDLIAAMNFVHFKMAIREHSPDYDIAFVEGAITRESEIERLKEIRAQATTLIALGACAVTGGIPVLKNLLEQNRVTQTVYGEGLSNLDSIPARPLDSVINVDYCVRGCPVDKKEFLEVAKAILLGVHPRISSSPVCVECKINENACLFDQKTFCLGPIIRSGCRAVCPSNGVPCHGCRGLVEDPNLGAEQSVLEEYGLTLDDLLGMFWIYNGYLELN